MTRLLRELERVESRALGALRFVDAPTRALVLRPLQLRPVAGRVRLVRNVTGDWVVAAWSALPAHEGAFAAPPAAPPTGSQLLRLRVWDPAGLYLPREVAVALPRDPDPTHASDAASLFRPVEVPLYPAPRAATGANWSLLRVTLREGGGDALGGALLRVRRNGDMLGRGLTDGRGEALVALPAVPMVTFGEDDEAVVVTEVAVSVQAVFDPGSGSRMSAAALAAGRPAPVPVVNPEALEDGADTLPGGTEAIPVAARQSRSLTLTLDLP
jgi:hypothetical protein